MALEILKGVRVLSFTQFLMGPAGVQYLADLGGDVIKVEPPGKGSYERTWAGAELYKNGVSLFFLTSHRNQRSLSVDLKDSEGREIAKRLAGTADVLVQNFRPGVMERLGLGYETLRAVNPRLIYVSVSGYGKNSPYKDRPGQDLLVQAISGIAGMSGRADGPPVPTGMPIVDQHGAALIAMGVLAALIQRSQTGLGEKLEVTMLRAALDLQMEVVDLYLNGAKLRRSPTCLASSYHYGPYGIYQTSDGGYIALSMSPLRALQQALEVQELEPMVERAPHFEDREEIARIVEPIIRCRTRAEWMEFLPTKGVWAAPVLDYDGTFADPAVQAADVVQELDHPVAGRVRLLRFPIEFSSSKAAITRAHPMVGEHTDEILQELGLSVAEISRLRERHVI